MARTCWALTRGPSCWRSTTQGAKFSLLSFLQGQTELCRVLVRKTDFPWLKRYAALVRPNPRAEKEGVAGYEIALNFNGVAFELIPRAASEIKGKAKFQLLSVNEAGVSQEPRAPPGREARRPLGTHQPRLEPAGNADLLGTLPLPVARSACFGYGCADHELTGAQ